MLCPKNTIEVESFSEKFGHKMMEGFIERAGVKSIRRSKEEQTASDLCFVVAQKLIKERALNIEEIGILIFITQTPDYISSATTYVLHKRLRLIQDCIAFDII